ncbi:MAG TPA: TolC family protein [Vicinamibacterales bacterium]|nr:TolC family protein [Vicinamibacterales bacterium]
MKFVLPAAVLLLSSAVAGTAGAQAPASAASGSSRQSAGVLSPFYGGVPSGTASAEAIPLTILDAIGRALEHNLGLLNAEESVARAQGSRWLALADLLPNVNGRVNENRQKVNLAAFGFPLPAGVPSLVGPFNVFDARINLSQPLFDLRAINAARAEQHNIAAARLNVRTARDLVVLVSSNLYLQSLAAASRVQSAQAQLQTAQAIFDQATRLKEGGIVAGIDVLRAEVQLGSERQRVTSTRNDLEKTKLQLARVIGLPPGQAFTLSEEIPYAPFPDITLEQALDRAYRSRPDYLAAQERLAAAEADRRAAAGEWLPSLRVNADYGRIGLTPGDSETTYAIAGSVNVPIFNGGRTRGKVIQADADLRMRRSELADLKSGIDFDVRSAFLDLNASSELLQVATRSRELAAQQLTQARDRFAAGVASNIEVVQAQEVVATSSEQYIEALYNFNVAKALLARDLGVAEDMARQLLGGVR